MTWINRQYGYLLELGEDDAGEVVLGSALDDYFKKFVCIYAGYDSAEFVGVEQADRGSYFTLTYTVDTSDCATCDEEGVEEGVCAGHGDEKHQEFIYYKVIDIYG